MDTEQTGDTDVDVTIFPTVADMKSATTNRMFIEQKGKHCWIVSMADNRDAGRNYMRGTQICLFPLKSWVQELLKRYANVSLRTCSWRPWTIFFLPSPTMKGKKKFVSISADTFSLYFNNKKIQQQVFAKEIYTDSFAIKIILK